MNTQLRRGRLSVLAVLALFATLLASAGVAQAAPAGAEGDVVLSPTSGDQTTSFDMVPDVTPANCAGDTANDGYTWQAFLAPTTVDPLTIAWGGAGPSTAGVLPLLDNGNPVINNALAVNTGQIIGEPATGYEFIDLVNAGVVAAGTYNIGIACSLAGATDTFWASEITFTTNGANLDWSIAAASAVPDAPVLDTVTPGDGELGVAFTPGTANPAATSFEATATPQGGGTPVSVSGAASPLTITGLTNGTTYDVTVTATNTVGASAASNTASGTPTSGGGSALQGLVVLTPASGDQTTSFDMVPDVSPAVCPGDTANDGYTWQSFLAPDTIDPSTITYGGSGPSTPGVLPLLDNGNPVINKALAVTTGQIIGEPTTGYEFIDLVNAGVLAAGTYNIGIACSLAGATVTYWATAITFTTNGANLDYAAGATAPAAPDAPVLDSVTPGGAELTVTFTPGAATPPASSFEATATPQGGGTPVSVSGAASPLTITGLTNGTTYDVVVTATNSEGTSPASNSLSGTPQLGAQPPVTNLVAVPGAVAGDIDVSWTAPAGVAPIGYTLTVDPVDPADPAVTGSPFTLGSATNSQTVSGLGAGIVYEFTVLATYTAPDFGTAAAVQAASSSAQVLNQVLSVTRPAGALILTQRCGVWNGHGAFTAVDAFPGFPSDLAAETATSDQIGTSPDADLVTAGQQDDPEFGNYPFPNPVTYPTECGVDLGTASFVSTGSLAGQYYEASGFLQEVTVVDTRDNDIGWTVNGTVTDFVSGTNSFDGNHLGWVPVVTSDSPGNGTGYDQTVTAGGTVLPGTGLTGATTGTGLGDTGGQPLGSAAAGSGLGVAVLDARLMVLVPIEADAGTYDATLALTVG